MGTQCTYSSTKIAGRNGTLKNPHLMFSKSSNTTRQTHTFHLHTLQVEHNIPFLIIFPPPTHLNIPTYIHVHTRTYIHTRIHTCNVCASLCMYAYMWYACLCECVCVCMCVCTCHLSCYMHTKQRFTPNKRE